MQSTSIKPISLIGYNAPNWSIQRNNVVILDHSSSFPVSLSACLSVTRPSFEAWFVPIDVPKTKHPELVNSKTVSGRKLGQPRQLRYLERLINVSRTVRWSSKIYPSTCMFVCHKPTLPLIKTLLVQNNNLCPSSFALILLGKGNWLLCFNCLPDVL